MNRLAGGEQGGAPHITVLSQRRGARRGLAGELVRRMSQHQGVSFRHVDLDSVDTGSGDLACGTREAGNITFLSLHCTWPGHMTQDSMKHSQHSIKTVLFLATITSVRKMWVLIVLDDNKISAAISQDHKMRLLPFPNMVFLAT